jgi:transcriptional regulator with GAF, ATPase, and Fis domain
VLTASGFCAKPCAVRVEAVGRLLLAIARERRTAGIVDAVVRGVAAEEGIALARVWLRDLADGCLVCGHDDGLHLVASAGRPGDPAVDWTRADGEFHRVPLGAGKIGKVGAAGSATLLHDMSDRSSWIVRPGWAAEEGIRCFAAQPLVADGAVLGVLGVFARARLDGAAFAVLRAVADHAAASIATARELEALGGRTARLEREVACLRDDARAALGDDLAAAGAAGRRLLEQIALAAGSDAAVLVSAAPGAATELVARRIHEGSRRAGGPFLKLACAAVPAARLPGMLLGDATTAGRHAAAGGGTLFLDEAGALPLDLQDRLLELLERGPGRRGRADVRIVAGTARDLAAEAAAGRFREALHCRLSVLSIAVASPPERDVIRALDWRRRERANLEAALCRAGGRIYGTGGAAALLGVPPTTLASRVKALGIARRPAR